MHFGSYSPNGNSVLQFRESSKTFDIMIFLVETRKINLNNKNTTYNLQLLLNRYYNQHKEIIDEYDKIKYYDNTIKREIIKNKKDNLRNEIKYYGKDLITLIDNYESIIENYISQNISNREIHDTKILKKDHDKKQKIQREISLAKSLKNELNTLKWIKNLKNEKEIILVLDNATIHHAVLTKDLAKLLNINLIYLPKYASDLNPIERVWYAIKHELSTEYIEDKDYLKENFTVYFDKYAQTDSLSEEFLRIYYLTTLSKILYYESKETLKEQFHKIFYEIIEKTSFYEEWKKTFLKKLSN